ncbi:hypothetical protein ACNOYE_17235 [Nannocystaceae bacterium ST9]
MTRATSTLLLGLPCLLLLSPACGGDDQTDGNDEIGNDSSSSESADAVDEVDESASSSADTSADTTATTTAESSSTDTETTADTADTVDSVDTSSDTADTTATTATTDSTTGDGDGDTTTGGDPCNGMGGGNNFEFSYLWASNSPQGTVSKIDTQAAVEVARYASGPNGATDPSRTSVSSDGKFAVVVNRNGGITMIAAEDADCDDANDNGMIDTSQGPNDVRPWGQDECVLWNVPLPANGTNGPRPVSWTIGEQDPITCQYAAGDVWVGWYDQGQNTGYFRLLEGMTGNTLDDVQVPGWSGQTWGPYGGAIDSENNFWAIGWGQTGPVVKIDAVTHEATHYGSAGGWIYGMGLDLEGNTWAGGCGNGNVYRFHKANETWSTVLNVPGVSCLRGLQVDFDGVAWIAKNGPCGLAAIDTSVEPPQPIDLDIPIAGCSTPVGVSIDAEGFVWVVDQGANRAFKIDPDTYQVVGQVTGLVSPYTYSDMTGAGIAGQVNPQ